MTLIFKIYENPEKFLEDFEIEPKVYHKDTIDKLIKIIRNARGIRLSIPFDEALIERDLYYELDSDKTEQLTEYAIKLLKEMKLNKLVLYDNTRDLYIRLKNPMMAIDYLVELIHNLIEKNNMVYDIIVRDLQVMLVRGISPRMHERKLANISTPIVDVYWGRIINSKEEYDKYVEEYKVVEEFYKRLNEYLKLLSI